MPSTKLSGSGIPRTPRHPWTIEQKRCLLLLLSDHSKPLYEQATSRFNRIFQNEINATDFPHGVPISSIRAQYREHKQEDNASWAHVVRPHSWDQERKLRDELAVRIERAIRAENGEAQAQGIPSTNGTRTRKRKRSVVGRENGASLATNDNDDDAAALSLHSVADGTASHKRGLVVLIPSREAHKRKAYLVDDEPAEEQPTPRAPVKRVKTGLPSPRSTIQFIRNSGPTLQVSQEIYTEIQAGYSPPSEQEAHPPLSGLFYRFWDPSQSQGHNSESGFVAQRYVRSNAVPVRRYAPPAKHLDPTDLWNHLNEEPESTPFVSVSDSLVWSLSKLLKLIRTGKWKDPKLSIINSSKLSGASVFHAAGFYRQLKRLRSFTNGAHRGVSSHEYLIWRDIPSSAVIKTINASELLSTVAKSQDLTEMMRLEILSGTRSYQTGKRPQLQQGKVEVSKTTAVCTAKIAQLLGLQASSAFEHHRHIVHDLVSSYKMVVSYHDSSEWRDIAAHYAHPICRTSDAPVSATDQALLRLAFLEGVRLGSSCDFKFSRIDAKIVQSLQRKAQLIGLQDPGRVVSGEADAVKLRLGLEQKRQWKVFDRRPSQMLLEDGDDDGADREFEIDDSGMVL